MFRNRYRKRAIKNLYSEMGRERERERERERARICVQKSKRVVERNYKKVRKLII